MTSPLLQRPGAVPADPPDAGVAAHYGDPFREQRLLAERQASVDLSHRPVVRVAGPDRLSWLHSLTSQHLERLEPGVPTEALVLSPHGHVEHALALVDDGEAIWAHVEPGTAEGLVTYLDSMRFWSKVEVEDVSEAYAVVLGPEAVAGAPARPTPEGVESFVPRSALTSVLDGDLAGVWALEALRIAAGRPRLGLETDHRTIPHEVGWIPAAVHLDKGCYRGQETVARVHNLGRPPRRLVLLHLDGSDSVLPGHGDPVLLEDRQVGHVTSSARHYELGPVALALVKRSTPPDAPLVAGGVAAAQEVIVPA
ncbi:MAG TPA: glycine cleavage T C-terminal barrel domain-containing protein [Actinomycetes bacterium]|nr:glycine cleavage T C-terminal barrel domain-containing protein [Actinomycetes bacterium]